MTEKSLTGLMNTGLVGQEVSSGSGLSKDIFDNNRWARSQCSDSIKNINKIPLH